MEDVSDELGSLEHKPSIDLYEVRARSQRFDGVEATRDAADRDDRHLRMELTHLSHQREHGGEEARAAQSTGFVLEWVNKALRTLRRGVAHDDARAAAFDDGFERLLERESTHVVWGDFHEKRTRSQLQPGAAFTVRLDDAPNERSQVRFALELAQFRRVRRADVPHQVVPVENQSAEHIDEVDRSDGVVGRLHLPERKADRSRHGAESAVPRESLGHSVCTVTIEAHPVYDGVILRQTKQARTRVAFLRSGKDGSHLDVAEPEREEREQRFRMLVATRGKSEAVWKGDAAECDGLLLTDLLRRADEFECTRHVLKRGETTDSKPMCDLSVVC